MECPSGVRTAPLCRTCSRENDLSRNRDHSSASLLITIQLYLVFDHPNVSRQQLLTCLQIRVRDNCIKHNIYDYSV